MAKRRNHWSLWILIFLVLTGLDAYTVLGIPLSWVGKLGLVVLGCLAVRDRRVREGSLIALLCGFVAWMCFSTAGNVLMGDYEARMPPMATTSYIAYICLRVLGLLVFSFTVISIRRALCDGEEDFIVKGIAVCGLILSVLALYVFVAHKYDLPEPARTRIGTDGGEQAVQFSYFFHRALGTFREPSHMAAWLILPFFLSLAYGQWRFLVSAAIIASAIVLSGSLTGIISAGLGVLIGVLFGMAKGEGMPRAGILRCMGVVLASFVMFSVLAFTYEGEDVSLIEALQARIGPIIREMSFAETNRASVFEFMAACDISPLGVGLGHPNILLSDYLGSLLPSSLLNLYYNVLVAGGIVGGVLLALILAAPIAKWWKRSSGSNGRDWAVMASYSAWLVIFFFLAEEFEPIFGVAYSLLAFSRERKCELILQRKVRHDTT